MGFTLMIVFILTCMADKKCLVNRLSSGELYISKRIFFLGGLCLYLCFKEIIDDKGEFVGSGGSADVSLGMPIWLSLIHI